MKLTPAIRLFVMTLILIVGTAIVWWFVGFNIGKGLLGGTGAFGPFRRAYDFEERALAQLFAFALLSPLALAVFGSFAAQARWAAVAALSLGAALVFGDRAGASVGFAVFTIGAAAVAESHGGMQIAAAMGAALLAAFAFILGMNLDAGPLVGVVVLRAAFFFLPLLMGPVWIERWVLGRLPSGRS